MNEISVNQGIAARVIWVDTAAPRLSTWGWSECDAEPPDPQCPGP
jgi:hypothetical protein